MTEEEIRNNIHQWLEALRSGKYKQGRGFLNYNNESFCCLGVACDLFAEKYNVKTSVSLHGTIGYDNQISVLPEKIKTTIGLYYYDGNAKDSWNLEIQLFSLTELNDQQRRSFIKIADHLEKYWKYYFTIPKKPSKEKNGANL